jgi:MFS family permease
MDAKRLFLASRIALITTAMCFGFRANAVGFWATDFHLTHEQLGWVNGTAFWGFTLAMMFGGPLCDALGLGRILSIAWVGHLSASSSRSSPGTSGASTSGRSSSASPTARLRPRATR